MKSAVCFLVLGCALLSATSVRANVAEDLEALREDVLILQRQVYRGIEEKASSASVPAAPVSGDVQVKIGEYDELVRKINGRMDVLEHEVKQLNEKLDKINRDVNIRFKILEGRQVPAEMAVPALTPAVTYSAPVASSAPRSVVGDSIQGNDLAPIAGTKVLGQPSQPEPEKALVPTDGAPQQLVPMDIPTVPATPTKPASASEMYSSGMEALNSGYYDEAELAFNHILKEFPKDKLAGNAQYWLGETFYRQKDYNKAKVAFKKGYEDYRGGNKAPDSLFKLGLTLKAQNDNKRACIVFMSFAGEFPKANASLSKLVNAEKTKLGCK